MLNWATVPLMVTMAVVARFWPEMVMTFPPKTEPVVGFRTPGTGGATYL